MAMCNKCDRDFYALFTKLIKCKYFYIIYQSFRHKC